MERNKAGVKRRMAGQTANSGGWEEPASAGTDA